MPSVEYLIYGWIVLLKHKKVPRGSGPFSVNSRSPGSARGKFFFVREIRIPARMNRGCRNWNVGFGMLLLGRGFENFGQ